MPRRNAVSGRPTSQHTEVVTVKLPHQWLPKVRMEAVSPLGVPFHFIPPAEARPGSLIEIRVLSDKGPPGQTSSNTENPVQCRIVGEESSATEAAEERREELELGADARCRVCNDGGNDEQMLLCDICDSGFHIYCLTPPMAAIPHGDWHCSECSKSLPDWAKFKVNDRCVAKFEKQAWLVKILKIDGQEAFVHFDGWKKKENMWVHRKLLEPAPPKEELKRVYKGKLLTEEEEQQLKSKKSKKKHEQKQSAGMTKKLKVFRKLAKSLLAEGKGGTDSEASTLSNNVIEELNKVEKMRNKKQWCESSNTSSSTVDQKSEREVMNARWMLKLKGIQPNNSLPNITTLSAGCDDGWSDCCVECGEGGNLLCCDTCPRTFCLDCARLGKVPRGKWSCRPCVNSQRMIATGGGIGSDQILLQIQRLCETFPMTHFLGALSFDIARVRALAQACRNEGVSLNGMHEVSTAREAVDKLNVLLEQALGSSGGQKPQDKENGGAGSAAGEGGEGEGEGAGAGEAKAEKPVRVSKAAPPIALPPKYQKYEEVVTKFCQDGVCRPNIRLTAEQVELCRQAVSSYYNRVKYTIQTLQLNDKLEQQGFAEFKLRCAGRYDMQVPELETEAFKFLREDAPWLESVHAILGEDCRLTVIGCMLSQPGSQTQQWHSDGDHLSEHEHLPPYAVNIFVPLVDMTSALGPTEFVPTTHLLFNYEPITSITPITICTPAGECLFFDYRIKHRGLGNRGHYARPMLYITYGTKAWADKANFSKKRYAKLPPLLTQRPPRSQLPVDRQDRMKLLEATTSPDKTGAKKRVLQQGDKAHEEAKDDEEATAQNNERAAKRHASSADASKKKQEKK